MGYFDFVEIIKSEKVIEPKETSGDIIAFKHKNEEVEIDENTGGTGYLDEKSQNTGINSDISNSNPEYLRQLRKAISAIDKARDKNRK